VRAARLVASGNAFASNADRRVYLLSAKFGDAPAGGRGRRPVLPGTFTLMVIERAPAAH